VRLRVGTVPMPDSPGAEAMPSGRHGGGADECSRHMLDVVTVDGANHALHRRAHRRLTRSTAVQCLGFTQTGSYPRVFSRYQLYSSACWRCSKGRVGCTLGVLQNPGE
jgi:hypothetical protein